MRYLYILTLVTALLSTSSVWAQQMCCDKDQATRLDISASADIKAAPDIAVISSGVVTIAKTADQAMKDNSLKMNAVFAAVKKSGLADKDIQTSGLSLNPQYNYPQNAAPTITNYQATNTVTIKIRDMKNIGPVMDALIAQGANQLNGPNFSVDNPDILMDMARKEAVKKAVDRANLYAAAANMKVKRIIIMSEQGGYNAPMPMMAMARSDKMMASSESAPTPVATGEVGMSVTVSVSFELE
jgi:uncharacterized protein YggE